MLDTCSTLFVIAIIFIVAIAIAAIVYLFKFFRSAPVSLVSSTVTDPTRVNHDIHLWLASEIGNGSYVPPHRRNPSVLPTTLPMPLIAEVNDDGDSINTSLTEAALSACGGRRLNSIMARDEEIMAVVRSRLARSGL